MSHTRRATSRRQLTADRRAVQIVLDALDVATRATPAVLLPPPPLLLLLLLLLLLSARWMQQQRQPSRHLANALCCSALATCTPPPPHRLIDMTDRQTDRRAVTAAVLDRPHHQHTE